MEQNLREPQINWYTVKLLFESLHSGNPLPDKIDEYDSDSNEKLFEESIILVKAMTIDQAYKIAEDQAKKSEHEYMNTYGQLVKWQFVSIVDGFEINDNEWKNGMEVYSRFIHARKEENAKDIVIRYYPEALDLLEKRK